MRILAIDTSCDDTAIAVVKVKGKKNARFEILANVVSSQVKIHQKYGGVYPMLARREHAKNLVPVLEKTLEETRLLEKVQSSKFKVQSYSLKLKVLGNILEREKSLFKKTREFLLKYQEPKIDLIAVTVGPGLEPCLWQGVNFAKALSFFWEIPVVPVNHIEAHIAANWLSPTGGNPKSKIQNFKELFPAICLIVSGGHTQLILMKGFGGYMYRNFNNFIRNSYIRNKLVIRRRTLREAHMFKILGETRDDAAGECFDKTARVLGLGYPGGPAIAKIASQNNRNNRGSIPVKIPVKIARKSNIQHLISNIQLPRPMINSKDYDFSFSGLKTAVLYDFKKRPAPFRKSKAYIQAMAKEIQQAIIDVLIKKTIKAAKDYRVKTIILGGGVAANQELRKQLKEKIKKDLPNIQYLIPNIQLCTDNAAMVAAAGYCRYVMGETKKWKEVKANANLRLKYDYAKPKIMLSRRLC